MALIGFVVNPVAGMGGRVGLKGTDHVADEARRRGAVPISHARAMAMLTALRRRLRDDLHSMPIEWLTCRGPMGADALVQLGYTPLRTIETAGAPSDAEDTKTAAGAFLTANVSLVLFCGGDGTARDIASVIGNRVPLLGIPSGVKMYSGVFGSTPAGTAEILVRFLKGELQLAEAEILDLDEDEYRAGKWVIRLHYTALTPYEPAFTQASKQIIAGPGDDESKAEIAAYLREVMASAPDTLFVMGPGSTVEAVSRKLGASKSLLGVDALVAGVLVGTDLSERDLLSMLDRYATAKLVLSPIGAQGFVLGRGNLQISPPALRRIGHDNIIVIATPAKLARTPVLRFDTGDADLDAELTAAGHLLVIIGYRRMRLVRAIS